MKPSELYDRALAAALTEATLDSDEEVRERHDVIARNPHTIKRLGAMAIHEAVHFVGASRFRSLYELPYRKAGIEVLGYGFNSTVVRDPDGHIVRKVVRGSNRLKEADRAALVQKLQGHIAVNDTFHPGISVPTGVGIGLSPVINRPTVQLVQPYIPSSCEKPDPRQIIDFAEKSLEEMMPRGFLPDVAGRQNIVNTSDGIRLIDTVAISAEDSKTFGRCIEKLYEMAGISK